jgi:hypothetical protein
MANLFSDENRWGEAVIKRRRYTLRKSNFLSKEVCEMNRAEFLKKLSEDKDFRKSFVENPEKTFEGAGVSLEEAVFAFGLAEAIFPGRTPGVTDDDCKMTCTLDCSGSAGTKTGTVKGNVFGNKGFIR